jgi:hypothetical protein
VRWLSQVIFRMSGAHSFFASLWVSFASALRRFRSHSRLSKPASAAVAWPLCLYIP